MSAARATRDAFGDALLRIGADPGVVVLGADLNKSTKAELFAKQYPERFFEMGVAEHNMIGTAAGLALAGKVAWCSSFACFVAGRFETIRLSVCYSGANVRIVGTHAGIGIGEDGYSQMGLEDIAMMRTLPTMAVIQPADDIETERVVEALLEYRGPAYLRLTRQKVARVHREDYGFSLGKGDVLRQGQHLAILATGGTVAYALRAAEMIAADGVQATVVNMHTIKPLDVPLLLDLAQRTKKILTVEDHSIVGGLGGAVAEVLSEQCPTLLRRVGVRDQFGESATPEELYAKHHLDAPGIRLEALGLLGRV